MDGHYDTGHFLPGLRSVVGSSTTDLAACWSSLGWSFTTRVVTVRYFRGGCVVGFVPKVILNTPSPLGCTTLRHGGRRSPLPRPLTAGIQLLSI